MVVVVPESAEFVAYLRGLDTKMRMYLRKAKTSSLLECSSAEVAQPAYLSADDMTRVLHRDQRTVLAPFSRDANSTDYTKNQRQNAYLSASASHNDGSSSRHVIHQKRHHQPDESCMSSPHSSYPSLSSACSDNSLHCHSHNDLITAKNASDDSKVSSNCSSQNTTTHNHQQHEFTSTSTSCHRRSSSFASKLLGVLTISACVLSLVNLPYTSAAPMTDREYEVLKAEKPFWQNPCEISPSYASSENSEDFSANYPGITNQQLIESIVLMSQQAIDHYKTFMNLYVTETFKLPLADHIKEWKSNEGYPWLPRKEQIPKNLNESLPKHFKSELELEKALLDSYEYLQKVAVGMETVATDHNNRDSDFKDHFKKSIDQLRTVLCEVQSVILNCKIQMREDVQRDIMPEEIRNFNDETNRHIRDWLIFRDYMNVMEFVNEVFHHLSENMQ